MCLQISIACLVRLLLGAVLLASFCGGEVPPLKAGDSYVCEDQLSGSSLELLLGECISDGTRHAIFVTTDEQIAVKVEKRRREYDKYGHLRSFQHECEMMRALKRASVPVPACRAVCEKDGLSIIVMDFVKHGKRLDHVAANPDGYDAWKIATHVYSGIAKMLRNGITQPGLDGEDMLVDQDSKVYFLDMGRALHVSELPALCRDEEWMRQDKNFQYFGSIQLYALGAQYVCESLEGTLKKRTAASALASLPWSLWETGVALDKLFCADPMADLIHKQYHPEGGIFVASKDDWLLKPAFSGVDEIGIDRPMLKQFEEKDGVFVKVGDAPVTIRDVQQGANVSYHIPIGAELVAVKCSAESTDAVEWSLDNFCGGNYFFATRDSPVVMTVMDPQREPGFASLGEKCYGKFGRYVTARSEF